MVISDQGNLCVVDRNLTVFVLILTYIHELRIFEENSLIHRTLHHITIPNTFSPSLLQLISTQLTQLTQLIRLQTTVLFISNFLASTFNINK